MKKVFKSYRPKIILTWWLSW